MTTKLEAINQMLSGIGQAPGVSLDVANPEIAIALDVLEQVDREVQGEGWHFNTEVAYPFQANTSGYINVPSNILQISDNKIANKQKYQTVLRNGRLYDKLTHTDKFAANLKIKCDVVIKVEFEDLPAVFQDYIAQRATRVFSGRALGSQEMVTFNAQDEALLRANCIAYDTSSSDVNIFGQETGQNYYISYTPFRAIAR
jgi:hypothetical protein